MTNTPCVRGPGSLLSVLLSSAATGNIVCTPAAMDLEDRLWLELLKETSIEEAVQMLWVHHLPEDMWGQGTMVSTSPLPPS